MRAINLCLIVLCFPGWTRPADQPAQDSAGYEAFRIITDREMYVTGESVHFRIYDLQKEPASDSGFSKVYYLELISPDGASHAKGKYTLDHSGAEGAILIPMELPSGNYYLKGYTRWMRNRGPEYYSYLSVGIVNPEQKSVIPVDTAGGFTVSPVRLGTGPGTENGIITDLKANYTPRSRVEFELGLDQRALPASCCVTVIRDGASAGQWEYVQSDQQMNRSVTAPGDWVVPETRGLSLTGQVVKEGSDDPAPYAVVYMTLIGRDGDFYCNYANASGKFYFAFPEIHGEKEIFISTSQSNSSALELHIDRDFCELNLKLPSFPLDTDPQTFDAMKELSVNAQISGQYYSSSRIYDDTVNTTVMYFYGRPSSVVAFDDFIRLPTMEEYFAELIPEVSVRRSNDGIKFRVWGNQPELGMFDPLVMVDGVAIFDMASVLGISPRLVDRVEIVESTYIRGNVTFGGIVNIITRESNMGYIDLPSSGLLLDYRLFELPVRDNLSDIRDDPRMPDVRNTLYWNPSVELVPGEQKTIRFFTSDAKGKFQLRIRGYNSEGEYIDKSVKFTVM